MNLAAIFIGRYWHVSLAGCLSVWGVLVRHSLGEGGVAVDGERGEVAMDWRGRGTSPTPRGLFDHLNFLVGQSVQRIHNPVYQSVSSLNCGD